MHFLISLLGAPIMMVTKKQDKLDKKSLGCNILFRESLDIGFRINDVHGLMFHLDHISNAKLCSTNEGLESFGIRYGYKF